MDNFTVIYKILKALEQAMDYDEFDIKQISHTRLNISYPLTSLTRDGRRY